MQFYAQFGILGLQRRDGCLDMSLADKTIGSHRIRNEFEVQHGNERFGVFHVESAVLGLMDADTKNSSVENTLDGDPRVGSGGDL